MPTYNRLSTLKITIPIILEQVNRHPDLTELVLCNNASTDGTIDYINSNFGKEQNLRIVDYDKYVDVSESINRAASNSNSKFLLLWGDDDIPSPMMVDTILMYLQKYPDISCLVFNRLQGHMCDNSYMNRMSVFDNIYNSEAVLESSDFFIHKHYEAMGFLSVNVITTETWKKGLDLLERDYPGYNWLAIMLFGIGKTKCLYVNFPLCAQRIVGRPEYYSEWPLYGFLGIPRLLKDCGEKGILPDWKESYRNYQFNYKSFKTFAAVFFRCSTNKSKFQPYVDEICSYQNSCLRKVWARFCILYIPSWVQPVFMRIVHGKGFDKRR